MSTHVFKISLGTYLKDKNVQWETKDDYLKCMTKQKVLGSFKIEYV